MKDNQVLAQMKLEEVEDALRIAGVDPDAFEILIDYPILLPSAVDPNQGMVCIVAISKANGMVFMFANKVKDKEDNLVVMQ